MRTAAWVTLVLGAILFTQNGQAHKGITSKFTYNVEVYPVFLNRCGRCHVDGGVGPMSLLKYEDAFPWAESLRAELLAAATGEGSSAPQTADFVRAAHRQLSARELDIVLDWATGGTPEGDKSNTPPPHAFINEWTGGTPQLMVSMIEPFVMGTATAEATEEFVVPISIAQPRNADRFDVLPGNPAIVRSATISIRSKDGGARSLGTWFPRQVPIPIALKPAARLEPGAEIIARIHYKKTWKFEGESMADRSTIGFYFAD